MWSYPALTLADVFLCGEELEAWADITACALSVENNEDYNTALQRCRKAIE